MTDAAGRVRTNVRRLSGSGREPGVDLARGLAVLGMLAAHLLDIDAFSLADPDTWLDVVNGRSSILFAVLAGVSIALLTGGTRPVTGAVLRTARARLAVRAAGLWALGILLILTGVPVYVILPAYAILFLIALPLLRLRPAPLFATAAGILLVMPFVQALLDGLPVWDGEAGASFALLIGWAYPFPLWAGFLVLGLAVGRVDFSDPRISALMVAAGGGISMIAYGVGGLMAPRMPSGAPDDYLGQVTSVLPHSGGAPEVVGGAGFALAVLGLCVLVCRTPAAVVLFPLRATGSMPLTAYTLQILVWAGWALLAMGATGDLSGFRALHPFWPIAVSVVIACTLWAMLLGRGPLEGLLMRLSRWLAPSRPAVTPSPDR